MVNKIASNKKTVGYDYICIIYLLHPGLQQGLGGTSANAQAQAQAHMMQFNPLLYSYQLSMAHQALGNLP